MKHWSDFLKHRTHTTKRLGKIANTLSFEILNKELELQSLKHSLDKLEVKISGAIAQQYTNETDYTNAIELAKTKAHNWNNSSIENHKPHTQKSN